ncbi:MULTISPECIES: hypothetical protein [Paenibacillus]|uniref:hypothetical protein n=1 Tax=Paenibacillus TaxID=44249 RepID=UPI0022B86D17|nr:hypothetical protein [Paenibacillus caseinilyticus]MCZ8521024.1 hypothetical protein [Paenibacillus caseinilyticus]
MNLALGGFALYLTYYTFTYARKVWKDNKKAAGLTLVLLSGCFVPLTLYLLLR